MSIKLSDLICEKCIYAYLISRNKDLVQCRRHTPDTWDKCNSDAWCGEGEWRWEMGVSGGPIDRRLCFHYSDELLKDAVLIDPHEA